MTGAIPNIFDARLLALRRGRSRHIWAETDTARLPAFLVDAAVDDIVDRLRLIRRDFRKVVVLGAHCPALIDGIRALHPGASITVADTWLPEKKADEVIYREIPSLETLELAESGYDLAVSPLLLQWVNDLPGVLAQVRRALNPDGLFVGNLIGGRSLAELRAALLQAEAVTTDGAGLRVHPMIDVRDLGGLLQRAKFALPVADTETLTVRYGDIGGLLRDLRALGATNVLTEQARRPLGRRTTAALAAAYVDVAASADRRITATFELLTMTGWAPHASQQQPMKPGSAQHRLADVLRRSDDPV